MPNQTTTSRLDLKVNARELGALDKQLKAVFGAGTPRAFNTAISQVNRQLEQQVKRVGEISDAMGKVKEGTDAFKRLQKELKEATRDAANLERAMSTLHQSQQRLAAGAGRALGGAAGGAVAPGAVGGGGSRLAGLQIGMPGMAALGTTLSALPVAGVAAAGSLMAAAGTYSSRLRYEQARMQAAPFLMPSAAATSFQRRQVSAATPGRIVGAEGEEFTGPMTVAQAREQAAAKLAPAMWKELARKVFKPDEAALGSLLPQSARRGIVGFIEREEDRRAGRIASGEMKLRDRAAVQAVGAMAQFAETFGGSAGMQRVYGRTLGLQFQRGQGAQYNQAFDAASYMREGIQFGVNPAEALQQAAGLGRAAGRPMGAQDFGYALALQRTTGVGMEQQGAMLRGLRRTGGKGSMQELADAIGLAVASGLEGSELGEELQKQSGFLQQQAQQGIMVDMRAMQGAQVGLQAAGIRAFRAGDIARSFAQGGANVGFTGPQRAVDLRLMRAMGFTGRGGPEEYARFRLQMQQPGKVAEALPAYLSQFQTPGMGDNMRTLMIQQALAQFGARVGPEEAKKLMELQKAGAFDGGVDLEKLKAAGIDLTKVTGGNLRAEAAIEAERVKVGAEVAQSMQNLSRITNDMAGSFMNLAGPVLQRVTEATEGFTTALEAGTASLGGSLYGETLTPR